MRLGLLRLLAAISGLVLLGAIAAGGLARVEIGFDGAARRAGQVRARPYNGGAAGASERPRYGGKLTVELGQTQKAWKPGSVAKGGPGSELTALNYETLVRIDAHGEARPWLADSWERDVSLKKWKFHLRPGVKFQDGTPLAPGSAVDAFHDAKLHALASGDSVQFDLPAPMSSLPEQLTLLNRALVHYAKTSQGTGPFATESIDTLRGRMMLAANIDYWGGRAFVDSIEVRFDRAARDRLIDLEVGKADLVEIPAEMARRAGEEKIRVEATPPVELLAIAFSDERGAGENVRLREALSHAIDRAAIVNLVLQKEGEIASALLPQWVSGTEFLHPDPSDSAAARALVKEIAPAAGLVLGYDSDDPLEKGVAERIAVNAREAGITVNLAAIPEPGLEGPTPQSRTKVDLRLVRMNLSSPLAGLALADLLSDLGADIDRSDTVLAADASAAEIYEREKSVLESYRVIPIAHLPRVYGIGPRVRNWAIPPGAAMNGLPLADVWLEREEQ